MKKGKDGEREQNGGIYLLAPQCGTAQGWERAVPHLCLCPVRDEGLLPLLGAHPQQDMDILRHTAAECRAEFRRTDIR
jgi:hypothetical protein